MSTMAAMASELDTKEGKAWPLEGATSILLTLKHLPQKLNSYTDEGLA